MTRPQRAFIWLAAVDALLSVLAASTGDFVPAATLISATILSGGVLVVSSRRGQ